MPFLLALLLTSVHAQNIQNDSLLDGYLSYQKGDWTNAAFFLRKAATDPSVSNDSVWYMIIMSEMNMEKFSNALSDCNYFMQTFNDSSLLPNVKYQRGRILHYVGQNDNAVLELSDFCHENPESPVYSSALFWIAECFYEDYSFETAKTLYERVVSEFPESSKVEDSLFKISLINQREREEKLLYLLKLTGEEYLSARETYEKTGKYCAYLPGSKKFREFWKEQYKRCKYGMTVNGYTVTGFHYFFLNYYTLPLVTKV